MANLVHGTTSIPLQAECVIGRKRDCGLKITDDKASRQHARVFLVDGEWWLEDLESANGTSLNGKSLKQRAQLHDKDIIVIGKSEIRFNDDAHASQDLKSLMGKDLVGQTIAGHRITGLIGRGVTGTIYTAEQVALQRGVAFKIMDPRLAASDPGFGERFLKMVTKACSITHDGIVRIHECGHDANILWYTMELMTGDTLEQLLKRDGAMEPSLALLIAEKTALALQAAHNAGIVHGDVKPATIMLTETGHVKILDIGIAGLTGKESRLVQAHAATKQVFYLSPEQAKGGTSDVRSDIYSLGCVIFHSLTGKVPFGGANFKEVVAAHEKQPVPEIAANLGLPPKIDQLLVGMMNKNVEWRFASMDEVVAELRALREIVTPGAHAEGAEDSARAKIAERARKRVEQRRSSNLQSRAMMLLCVVAIAVVIGFVGLPDLSRLSQQLEQRPEPPSVPLPRTGRGPSDITPPRRPDVPKPPPTKDAWVERWQQLSPKIDASAERGDWGAAELALARFSAELAAGAPDSDIVGPVRLRTSQLQSDADASYQKSLAAMPSAADAGGLSVRLRQLAALRDVTIGANRGDAEARYQEALAKLKQRLDDARRQARRALEAGQLDQLVPLATSLEPAFTATPVAGLHRQFHTLVSEAAAIRPQWKGSWNATHGALLASRGTAAIPAAAALMISGDANSLAQAKKLLADPALASGAALRRREALLGNEAAILSFDDIGDLQFIDTLQGDPVLANGALSGEDTCGLACTVPVGGESWSASLSLALATKDPQDAEAVISCVDGQNVNLSLRISPERVRLKVQATAGAIENEHEHALTERMRVRLSCRAGTLTVLIDDEVVASVEQARIPAGSQLRFEVGGFVWKLDDLQVLASD
ncbi:MAG: protein kinase [Planctomycetes bacterium]|nr:protein kinase [Planctomycetota bacterium]